MEEFFARRIKKQATEVNQLCFNQTKSIPSITNDNLPKFICSSSEAESSLPSINDEESTGSENSLKLKSLNGDPTSIALSKFPFCDMFREKLEYLMHNENIYPLKQSIEDYLREHMRPPDLKNDFENEFNQIVTLLLKESQTEDILVEREHEIVTEFNIYYNDILIKNKENTIFFAIELKQVRFTSIIDSLIKYYTERDPTAEVLPKLKTYFEKNMKFNDNFKIYNEVFYGENSIKNKWIMDLVINKYFDEDKDPHNNIMIKNLPNLFRKRNRLYRKLLLEKYNLKGKVEMYYLIRIGPTKIVSFYEHE